VGISMPDYLWVVGVIGHLSHIFFEPVYILNIIKNLSLIMGGKVCRFTEIFCIVSQSVISDHYIPYWNILSLSQDLWTNIMESFWTVNHKGKSNKDLTYLHNKWAVFLGRKDPVAHCGRDWRSIFK